MHTPDKDQPQRGGEAGAGGAYIKISHRVDLCLSRRALAKAEAAETDGADLPGRTVKTPSPTAMDESQEVPEIPVSTVRLLTSQERRNVHVELTKRMNFFFDTEIFC